MPQNRGVHVGRPSAFYTKFFFQFAKNTRVIVLWKEGLFEKLDQAGFHKDRKNLYILEGVLTLN